MYDLTAGAWLQHARDALAELKLRMRVAELNFPGQHSRFCRNRRRALSPAEAEAQAPVRYSRICFARLAVHGIPMQVFWEGAN